MWFRGMYSEVLFGRKRKSCWVLYGAGECIRSVFGEGVGSGTERGLISGAGIWICTGSGVGIESGKQELEQRQGQKHGEDLR